MKMLKNIGVGFLVSYIGSVPLGYLNIIGYAIYGHSGSDALLRYLLGVIVIEAVVIYATFLFADKLIRNTKLIRFIEVFSIAFLLLLAWSFYSGGKSDAAQQAQLVAYTGASPFWAGIRFSCLNLIQVPFWAGWNIYLVNARYIATENKRQELVYLGGTLLGTFLGMLSLILLLGLATAKTGFLSAWLMPVMIPLFFVGMALYQSFQLYRKYYKKKK